MAHIDSPATEGNDLLEVLKATELEGRPLNRLEIMGFCMTLLVAGNETTRTLISGGMEALYQQPDQRADLADDPSLLPVAVEELLRWVTPIQAFGRTAAVDVELGGEDVAAGDFLVMLYASGNRDEAVFGPTAARLDVRRPVTPTHVAFGFGEHLCLGAALARLEARIFFEELLARYPDLRAGGRGGVRPVHAGARRGPDAPRAGAVMRRSPHSVSVVQAVDSERWTAWIKDVGSDLADRRGRRRPGQRPGPLVRPPSGSRRRPESTTFTRPAPATPARRSSSTSRGPTDEGRHRTAHWWSAWRPQWSAPSPTTTWSRSGRPRWPPPTVGVPVADPEVETDAGLGGRTVHRHAPDRRPHRRGHGPPRPVAAGVGPGRPAPCPRRVPHHPGRHPPGRPRSAPRRPPPGQRRRAGLLGGVPLMVVPRPSGAGPGRGPRVVP